MCFAPGRGLAALVVIHKHCPPKLGGGGKKERRHGGKKEKEAKKLSPGLKTGMTNTIS